MGLDEQRLELRAAPLVAAGGQGPQGVAVVALAAGDDVAALRLALLDEVLSRHLQGRLDGFGTAAHQVDVIQPGRRVRDQAVGQALRSEGHTSELQSLMRTTYAVFSLTKKNKYYKDN